MKKQTTLILLTILSFISVSAISQKAPMKFGKIDRADLEMTVYDKDTSAEAVVLCDYGFFNPDDFSFTRHYRVKILKKNGYNWVNRRVYTPQKSMVKGRTYNLENNEIVIDKLKNSSIYKERINKDFYRLNLAMPNVKVGSVVEVYYTMQGIPFEWLFQDEIPVKWSELRIPSSPYFDFQRNYYGYESLHINERHRWVAKDVPSLKKEPYINSITNYLSKFELELSNINFPGFYKDLTTSWEDVNSTLLKSYYFGKKLDADTYLNNIADSISKLNISDEEKIESAFELVKKEVKWNNRNSVYAYNDLNNVFKKKKIGNSSEINLILLSLIKKLGIEAYPVTLSTRKNGVLNPVFPTLQKFNYVVIYVPVNNKEVFLDATDKLLPVGLLPERCLNWQGRIISETKNRWIDLAPNKKKNELIYSVLNLDSDGVIEGKISFSRKDYAAYNTRKQYDKFNSEQEFIRDIEENNNGLTIEDYKLTNLDSIHLPMKDEYDVTIENMAESFGDKIYINPLLYEKIEENPFKLEKRKLPIDFTYPIEDKYILSLTIPDGYAIEEIPESVKFSLPENNGSFYYNLQATNNQIQLTCKYSINKSTFLLTEYSVLKEFYNRIVEKHSEQIILKKISNP